MTPQDFEGPNLRWRRWVRAQNHAYLPETHKIVATNADGSVSITTPTYEALYFMTGPGGYWNGYEFGFLAELVRRKTCPELQRGHPCTREAAERFVKAMSWGGRSCEEAWDILAQHDVARFGGTGIEIMHISELPLERDLPLREQRRYRDAWVRSHNGGPIRVDENLARAIDEKRQRKAA